MQIQCFIGTLNTGVHDDFKDFCMMTGKTVAYLNPLFSQDKIHFSIHSFHFYTSHCFSGLIKTIPLSIFSQKTNLHTIFNCRQLFPALTFELLSCSWFLKGVLVVVEECNLLFELKYILTDYKNSRAEVATQHGFRLPGSRPTHCRGF